MSTLLQRAVVVDTSDPLLAGRVQIAFGNSVLPSPVWAMVSIPVTADPAVAHPMPPIGSVVWVVFENEDENFPVVLGTVPALFPGHNEAEA